MTLGNPPTPAALEIAKGPGNRLHAEQRCCELIVATDLALTELVLAAIQSSRGNWRAAKSNEAILLPEGEPSPGLLRRVI